MTQLNVVSTEDAEEYTQTLAQGFAANYRFVLWAKRMGIPDALGMSTPDWVQERLGGYIRMSIAERREAARELTASPEEGGEGLSQREAADVLGVSPGTVNSDLRPEPVQNRTPEPEPEIEHSGLGPCDYPPMGQLRFLREEAKLGKTVFVLYGCGVCNSPQALRRIARSRADDEWLDWRGLELEERRKLLKEQIDRAMGLLGGEQSLAA